MKAMNRIRIISLSLLILFFSAFWLLLVKLSSGVDLSSIVTLIREKAAFVCTYRCLGIFPFLPFLMKSGRLLLLVFLVLALLVAVIKTVRRIRKTQKYMRTVEKRVIQIAPLFPDLNPVRIFKDPNSLAFTAGFFRPRVYLSATLVQAFEKNELRAIVLHESRHQKGKDPLKSLLTSFLADFLFFVPLASFLKKSYLLASEMNADSHCTARGVDPLEIACALLKVEKRLSLNAPGFFDQNIERIKTLLGQPIKVAPSLKKVIVSLVLFIILIFFSLMPVKKSSETAFLSHEKSCGFHRLNG